MMRVLRCFVCHNGADSYYAARGFRGVVRSESGRSGLRLPVLADDLLNFALVIL